MEANTSEIKHIAFIMDGNGRWAKAKGKPREYGHVEGAKNFKRIVRHCGDIGIKCVTVYAFSTENWKRPKSEVDALMKIFSSFIDEAQREYKKEKAHIVFIGNRTVFPSEMQEKMRLVEENSSVYERTLCIALNYGGRAEITDAVNALITSGKKEISEDDITGAIYSGCVPPPDMIIRTAGEKRLSNFLLWQSSYAELFFTDTLWPDLLPEEVDRMIEEFGKRKRNFGGV